MRRSILRRKVKGGGNLITKADIVNFKKKPEERTDILIALDSSKSMEQGGKLEQAKKAAISFFYHKTGHSNEFKVDFVSFNNRVKRIRPIDILSLKPEGMTHTTELFNFVFDYFNRGSKNTSEFYLITDGYPYHEGMDDTVYHALTLKSAERLKALNIKTKIIFLNRKEDENPNNYIYNKLISDKIEGELIQIDSSQMWSALTNQ